MKYRSDLRKGVFIAALSIIALSACRRNNDKLSNTDDNGGYASDNAKMEQYSNDVVSIADAAADQGSGGSFKTSAGGCATVTHDTVSMPHVLTIDFGTGCTGADGKIRSGKIIVTYSGHYKDAGSTHTITYNNYFVNGNQLSGYKTVTNGGTNSSGQVYYTVTVNDSLNLGSGNGIIVWTGSRVRTWKEGYSTASRMDDVYLISGSSSLTRPNGNTFVMTITTPLQVAINCSWIEAGIMTITGPGGGTRTLNYGTGDCDSHATLTMSTHTYNITLR